MTGNSSAKMSGNLNDAAQLCHALVVDDQEGVRAVVSTVLKLEGYEVTCAHDGLAGWDQFSQDPARWDIVLLDITMPGMNGVELDEQIQALRPGTPTVVMTGYAATGVVARLKRRVGLEVLLKPFALSEIRRCISSVRKARVSPGPAAAKAGSG